MVLPSSVDYVFMLVGCIMYISYRMCRTRAKRLGPRREDMLPVISRGILNNRVRSLREILLGWHL